MKYLMILTLLVMATYTAKADGDIPPPPMPSYMKKHPADVEQQKLQPNAEHTSQPSTDGKFLKKMNETPKAMIKTEPVAQIQDADEVRDEYLEDVDQEEVSNEQATVDPTPSSTDTIAEDRDTPSHTLTQETPIAPIKPKVESPVPRKPTSRTFKPGMHEFVKDCNMRSEADHNSDSQGIVKSGKKLWVDRHSEGWHKVYRKNGEAYISADCL